jgi:hypothetical protein
LALILKHPVSNIENLAVYLLGMAYSGDSVFFLLCFSLEPTILYAYTLFQNLTPSGRSVKVYLHFSIKQQKHNNPRKSGTVASVKLNAKHPVC